MVSAIIVAAGIGARMNDNVRKQYLSLAGRPVVSHALVAFDKCVQVENIFIVVPHEDFDYCRKHVLEPLELIDKVNLVAGGEHRQKSVYNGLLEVDKKTNTIVIHDGVRPFVQSEDIKVCIKGSKYFGACITGVPASDTLKLVGKSGIIEKTIARDTVWLSQTPQAFQYDLIMKAHESARQEGYVGTDDAMLVERMGKEVKIIRGRRSNLKITTRDDLIVARAMFGAEA